MPIQRLKDFLGIGKNGTKKEKSGLKEIEEAKRRKKPDERKPIEKLPERVDRTKKPDERETTVDEDIERLQGTQRKIRERVDRMKK